MNKILSIIENNPRLTRLQVIYPERNSDKSNSSVCLVDPITKNVYVVYGGNYCAGKSSIFDGETMATWVENARGAVKTETLEHQHGLQFYNESIAAARTYLGVGDD